MQHHQQQPHRLWNTHPTRSLSEVLRGVRQGFRHRGHLQGRHFPLRLPVRHRPASPAKYAGTNAARIYLGTTSTSDEKLSLGWDPVALLPCCCFLLSDMSYQSRLSSWQKNHWKDSNILSYFFVANKITLSICFSGCPSNPAQVRFGDKHYAKGANAVKD